MLTVRTMKQIATSRTIPSFRSCRTTSQLLASQIQDQGRVLAGYAQVLTQETQRQRRAMIWRQR